MRKLPLLALACALAACSKTEAARATEDPTVIKGPVAAASDPASLPPAGTAPTPTTIDKEIPMWKAAIKTLKGQPTSLETYQGKALMIVNVASQCGQTVQYSWLEALQKKYGPRGFTVIGFPSNQFEQEPGSAEEIATFCATTYGITFPMMEKIEVNGPGAHEIYKALTPIADSKGRAGDIEWNFEKFVVSADRTKVTRFGTKTKPNDPAVIAAVEAALPK